MFFTLREAIFEDAEAIYSLNRDEMGYTYSLEETKANFLKMLKSDANKIYVAVADNCVVGYIHACDYNLIYAPPMKNIMGIAVKREYKRNGIGKALLQRVEDWARETNSLCIRLSSGIERTDAHVFYSKCGYSFNKNQLTMKKILSKEL